MSHHPCPASLGSRPWSGDRTIGAGGGATPAMSRFAAPERLADMRLYDYAPSANCLKVRILLGCSTSPTSAWRPTSSAATRSPTHSGRSTRCARRPCSSSTTARRSLNRTRSSGVSPRDAVPAGRRRRAGARAAVAVCRAGADHGGIGGARFRLITGRPGGVERVPRARAGLRTLEDHLGGRPWVVGDEPTIADISLYAYAQLAPEAGLDLAEHPAVTAWLEPSARCRASTTTSSRTRRTPGRTRAARSTADRRRAAARTRPAAPCGGRRRASGCARRRGRPGARARSRPPATSRARAQSS